MINRLRIATMGLLTLSLLVPSAAFAQEAPPEHDRFRAIGEITGVVPGQGTFTLHTRSGEELEFQTGDRTRYRSPDGSIEDIHDLEKGMKALVVAIRQDEALQALLVAAGSPEDLPERIRVAGEIRSVDLAGQSFVLLPREGEALTFLTGERTRYRGEGIEDLGDLQPGMHALVVGVKQEDGGVLALLVAVGEPKDRPEILKFAGEITRVVPGQGTFTLMTRDGEEVEFQTSERTKFRSKDGSVQDIHDLKPGMLAFVGAIEQEDGTLLALVVGVGNPEDRPDRPNVDVRAVGKITAKDHGSFTLSTRGGEELTFAVTEDTQYKGVGSFEELEVGMLAAVGAKETDGGLLAVWVGVRSAPDDRPLPEDRPQREPDPSPNPADQEVSA